jgi:hypothetical protein
MVVKGSSMNEFVVPDETELLDFFESEPVERSPETGLWWYEFRESSGLRLAFSFNIFEGSIQTQLYGSERLLVSVSHEGARRISKHGDELRCECKARGTTTSLVVRLRGGIQVDWATLLTE